MHIAAHFQEREAKRNFGRDLTNLCKGAALEPKKPALSKEKCEPKKAESKDAIHDHHEDIFAYIASFPEQVKKAAKGTEVSDKMRQILIDWMVDVHQSFELRDETLFLSLKYLE